MPDLRVHLDFAHTFIGLRSKSSLSLRAYYTLEHELGQTM